MKIQKYVRQIYRSLARHGHSNSTLPAEGYLLHLLVVYLCLNIYKLYDSKNTFVLLYMHSHIQVHGF